MGEHARILIVDDDESIRTVLTAVLREKGYIVDTAESGNEGIEKTKASFYSLTLVDIRLPDMEGTQVLAKMSETTPEIKKIIITGYTSVQNAVNALNKGTHAYIMKPFDMDSVLKTIEILLKKQEEEKKYGKEKVTEFIETRVKELEEETATQEKRQRARSKHTGICSRRGKDYSSFLHFYSLVCLTLDEFNETIKIIISESKGNHFRKRLLRQSLPECINRLSWNPLCLHLNSFNNDHL
jgi:YesN/AraC family two-component response regulator